MAGKRAPAQPWSEEKQAAAEKGRFYIKLGDKRGTLLLSGAAKKWQSDPSFVYVPSLRVAGTPADIERVFVGIGIPAGDVRQHIASGYTAASAAGPLAGGYQAELDQLAASKKTAAKRSPQVGPMSSISEVARLIDSATVVGGPVKAKKSPKAKKAKKSAAKKSPKAKKSAAKKSPKAKKSAAKKSPKAKKSAAKSPKASPKGKRGARDLGDKIAALSAGKVMDVSKLHVDGSGAKTINMPGDKSKKVQVPGRMIVSDNKNGINAAAKILGDTSIVDSWVAARKAGKGSAKSSPRASPRSSGRSSPLPPLSPAKTLPMSPVGVPALPQVRKSPAGGLNLPTVRPPTLGSPRTSPRF